MWLNIAAAQGGPASLLPRSARDELKKEMTREQIAEGQRLSAECVAKEYKGCAR